VKEDREKEKRWRREKGGTRWVWRLRGTNYYV